ncbi:host-nuclease inhibitor Gam family protein [Sideroxydans lithotrophicus]|uniref:Uncharacterized protein n=1 Tax=Sideroxydans lithotrophicus (strain ES-1) TaxID=580332 RepID=D5CUB2_SIDLE|nr:host-nuclease inhibitor Gam family protein [Sideroxydans lithotrophicus]ADE10447.1 conserved hypothetical protein [Sideroxydans lithotrophicus ES-1]
MATMQEIETKAKAHAAARLALTNHVTLLNAEIEAVKQKRLKKLREAVATATETGDELLALVSESSELFKKPKSAVLHGIKLGFKKEKGRISFADEDQVLKLIRKHLPDLADVLIVTTEKPSKEAMNNLEAGQLKKIGVTVTADSDMAFISDPTSDVDKIVSALLKGASEAEAA